MYSINGNIPPDYSRWYNLPHQPMATTSASYPPSAAYQYQYAPINPYAQAYYPSYRQPLQYPDVPFASSNNHQFSGTQPAQDAVIGNFLATRFDLEPAPLVPGYSQQAGYDLSELDKGSLVGASLSSGGLQGSQTPSSLPRSRSAKAHEPFEAAISPRSSVDPHNPNMKHGSPSKRTTRGSGKSHKKRSTGSAKTSTIAKRPGGGRGRALKEAGPNDYITCHWENCNASVKASENAIKRHSQEHLSRYPSKKCRWITEEGVCGKEETEHGIGKHMSSHLHIEGQPSPWVEECPSCGHRRVVRGKGKKHKKGCPELKRR
ncbi:hypothetical protein NP233_g7575 [Leucocoprinus birnbaumii]|uniref:Uncharacterized protein n=1 Tax=Leucocoprinus birnbaumii TaxID=56174 RepID=A0AAD5VNX2_9AGAR|nr:hypothetical protein NP233_g7575 [Leucocoprinus birnbaumii]